jgi:hypothetical protein
MEAELLAAKERACKLHEKLKEYEGESFMHLMKYKNLILMCPPQGVVMVWPDQSRMPI